MVRIQKLYLHISLAWMPEWSMKGDLGQQEIHIKTLPTMQTSIKQINKIERTQEIFTEVPTQSYVFTPVLYSSTRNLNCTNVKYNFNKMFVKGSESLKCYKGADGYIRNEMVILN